MIDGDRKPKKKKKTKHSHRDRVPVDSGTRVFPLRRTRRHDNNSVIDHRLTTGAVNAMLRLFLPTRRWKKKQKSSLIYSIVML